MKQLPDRDIDPYGILEARANEPEEEDAEMEYDIVSANSHEDLVTIVCNLICQGWRPAGGAICWGGAQWYQTMVKSHVGEDD